MPRPRLAAPRSRDGTGDRHPILLRTRARARRAGRSTSPSSGPARRSSRCAGSPRSIRAATSGSSTSACASIAASSSSSSGPTGCGKTTLIKTLIRELRPTEGEVLIAGRDIGSLADKKVPAAAPPDRHRLPGLQAAPEPERLRQRRLRAAGDRRLALGDPQEGAGRPAPGRPRRQGEELPRPALRRRAAAPLGRPRLRQPPAAAAGRRADRQPRPQHLHRDHAGALPDQPHRHNCRRGHPRPRDGRQDASPRDRARLRSRRPRPGGRHLHLRRRVHPRVRQAASARRWGSTARSPAY